MSLYMAAQPSDLSATPQSFIFCKLNEDALGPIIQIINVVITQHRTQYRACRNSTGCVAISAGFHASGHRLLRLAAQLLFSPPHCPLLYYVLHQFINIMGDSVKRSCWYLQDALLSLCGPGQSAHHGRNQVSEAFFPLHKSMLTPPNPPVILQLFGSIFQVYLLHHLLRDRDEADQPLVLCALHLDLDGGSGIFYLYFFQFSRTSLITTIFRILQIVSWQCHQPAHSAMHLVKSHRLVSVQSV